MKYICAEKIILTFCVNLLRFALSSYVLGNVTFCGPTGGVLARTCVWIVGVCARVRACGRHMSVPVSIVYQYLKS